MLTAFLYGAGSCLSLIAGRRFLSGPLYMQQKLAPPLDCTNKSPVYGKGSWTLLVGLYKDAGTPANECSLSEF